MCAGISTAMVDAIRTGTSFVVGKHPVRYLGVPLVSKQLSLKDSQPLIDKVTTRVRHWTTKFLLYTGKLQLLQSVISSLQNY